MSTNDKQAAVPGGQFIPRLGKFTFKRAETDDEFEQVHRLNYRTFVKEIQQHEDNGQGRLVDKFHQWNTYFLALVDDRVIAMISVHDHAPFSVESRLDDVSVIRQPGMRPLEVRLLAIEQGERHGPVLVGLTYVMNYFAREHGYTHYLISALTEQIPLYRHLGFSEMGPPKGKPGAMFAPMMATLEQVDEHMQRTMVLWERRAAREAAAKQS
jgi:N-acyl amino acid synthase FeeM